MNFVACQSLEYSSGISWTALKGLSIGWPCVLRAQKAKGSTIDLHVSNNRRFGSVVLTIGVITASVAFVMELTLIPLLLSALQSGFELSVVELTWVFNAYAIAVALAVLCVAVAGDTMNKQRLFLIGVGLFAVGSASCAFSNDFGSLLISRLMQGVGGGLFFPLVPILLTQANPDQSGKILMVWGGLTGFVAALLPTFGAALLTEFGLPAVFVSLTLVAIAGLIFVTFGHAERGTMAQRHLSEYKSIFANRNFCLLLSYIFLTYGCFSYYLFHFSVGWRLAGLNGYSVSLFLTCVWLAFSVVSILLREKMEGRDLGRILLCAPALLTLSFAVALLDLSNPVLQVFSAVFAGAGLGCCNSPSTYLLLRETPQNLRAFSACMDIIFARLGSVATVGLFALAISPPVLLTIAVMALFTMFVARLFLRDFYLTTAPLDET